MRHLGDVRAYDFAQIRNHIDEGNLHREEGVESVLDQFGGIGVRRIGSWRFGQFECTGQVNFCWMIGS